MCIGGEKEGGERELGVGLSKKPFVKRGIESYHRIHGYTTRFLVRTFISSFTDRSVSPLPLRRSAFCVLRSAFGFPLWHTRYAFASCKRTLDASPISLDSSCSSCRRPRDVMYTCAGGGIIGRRETRTRAREREREREWPREQRELGPRV